MLLELVPGSRDINEASNHRELHLVTKTEAEEKYSYDRIKISSSTYKMNRGTVTLDLSLDDTVRLASFVNQLDCFK